jgi:dTDP-4-dehydrorhamnose 3,5-epimerase
MKLTPLGIEGAWIAESPVWSDERGFFREWFKSGDIKADTGIDFSIQQANISQSQRGVIRGIHYSLASQGQAKWVTCVIGSILDVVVDIRPNSPTYKKYVAVELKGNEGRALLIGAGLGHGFLALEDNTTISYLLSSPYSPEFELEIQPTDPEINIDWHLSLIGGVGVIVSPKDAQAPTLAERLAEGKLPK